WEQIGRVRVGHQTGLPQAVTELGGHRLGAIRVGDPAELAEEAAHRPIGGGLVIGKALPFKILCLGIVKSLYKLVEQPRLPNTGLANNPHDLAMAGLDLSQQCPQGGQLTRASDERAQEASAPAWHS